MAKRDIAAPTVDSDLCFAIIWFRVASADMVIILIAIEFSRFYIMCVLAGKAIIPVQHENDM